MDYTCPPETNSGNINVSSFTQKCGKQAQVSSLNDDIISSNIRHYFAVIVCTYLFGRFLLIVVVKIALNSNCTQQLIQHKTLLVPVLTSNQNDDLRGRPGSCLLLLPCVLRACVFIGPPIIIIVLHEIILG